ncbi:MAG: hypothetical protein A2Y40_01520 [Candidatus Margulisbacteria bacterium GWF2_35_9]|nr:MAG: hypothetical protein A2Y40_01520 [Candidatus Margulisbacteria bacterium GWF2_35_9]
MKKTLLLFILFQVVFGKTFKLYELQETFEHVDFLSGTYIFRNGLHVFGDDENFYINTTQRYTWGNKELMYYGEYNFIFPISEQRIANNIKLIENVEINESELTDINFNTLYGIYKFRKEKAENEADPFYKYSNMNDVVWIGTINTITVNETTKSQTSKNLDFFFFTNNGKIVLDFKDNFYDVRIFLSKEQRKILLSIIEKYFKWEKLALEKGIALYKNIDTIKNLESYFSIEENKHRGSATYLIVDFYTIDASKYGLSLDIRNLKSIDNEYVSHTPDQLIINKSNIEKIRNVLQDQHIINCIKESQKRKEEESIFK